MAATASPTTPCVTHQPRGSEAVTEGVRIRVAPAFMPEQSDAQRRQYVFSYHIRVTNEGPQRVQLLSRRWIILNAQGEREEVQGEGVVGRTPTIPPGMSFEYTSYCPLTTPWGTMEGSYHFRREDGEEFDAQIARFYLVVPR